jgi:hypothetical protein
MSNKVRIMPKEGVPEMFGTPLELNGDLIAVKVDKKYYKVNDAFAEDPVIDVKLAQVHFIMTVARAEAVLKSRNKPGLRCYVRVHHGQVSVGFGPSTGAVLCYKNGREILL